ncbi:MAG: hypothetical protein MJK11_16920 [Pseudomonadales bacterium]|nr:hypothetical protein [Pseudomonadales bacterium]
MTKKCRNGSYNWLKTNVIPIYDNKHIIVHDLIRTDVTSDQIKQKLVFCRNVNNTYPANDFIFKQSIEENIIFLQIIILSLIFLILNILTVVFQSVVFLPIIISVVLGCLLFLNYINWILFDSVLGRYFTKSVSIINIRCFDQVKLTNLIIQKNLFTFLERLRKLVSKIDLRAVQEKLIQTQLLKQDYKYIYKLVDNESYQIDVSVSFVNNTVTRSKNTRKQTTQNFEMSNQQLIRSIKALTQINLHIDFLNNKVTGFAKNEEGLNKLVVEYTVVESTKAGEKNREFEMLDDEVHYLIQRYYKNTALTPHLCDNLADTKLKTELPGFRSNKQPEYCILQSHQIMEKLKKITLQIIDVDEKYSIQTPVVKAQTQRIKSIDKYAHKHTLAY